MINSQMTNEQLLADANVKAAIEAGKVVIIDKKVTGNPDYTNIYFFGPVEGIGGSGNEGLSEAAAMFLDFNTSFNARCIQNAATRIANNFQVGQALDDFALRCVDKLTPSFEGQAARQNKEGKIHYHNGKEIYRNYELVTHAELGAKGHQTIDVTSTGVIDGEKPAGVNVSSVLEQTTK